MGCGNCGGTVVAGCKSNGGCSTGACNKMNVFNWLSNMEGLADNEFDVVEVRFKNGYKDFYRNPNSHEMITGDPVIVDVPNGHHLGYISMQGELVRLQMQKKKVKDDDKIRKIYRKASDRDLEKYE